MWSILLALIAGAILPFAFAPFNIYTIAFISPAILLYFWMKSTPRMSFLYGFMFGLGLFCVGSFWIYISIHNFGNASAGLAGFITFLFVLVMSLYPATLGYVFVKLFQNRSDVIRALCAFPALWVFWEWLRGWLFGGFPWFFLGYTQLTTPLRGWAPIFGVYGVSMIVAFIAGALVLLARRTSTGTKSFAVTIIIVSLIAGWGFNKINWTKPIGKPIQVSLVQGNIAQHLKWNNDELNNILKTYQTLTANHWSSQLIIWPEAAIPVMPQELHAYLMQLDQSAKIHNSTVIFGAPLYHPTSQQYFNGLLMLGKNHGHYLKRHLVPFGEYTPLEPVFKDLMGSLHIPMSGFSTGPKVQGPLHIDVTRAAPFICYETAFPIMAANSIKGTQMIITILDDGWFGKSIALPQQLQMAQMRALETGRPLMSASNTGITAFINPKGIPTKIAPIDKKVVLTQKIQPMAGNTPLLWWLYYPVFIVILLLILIAAAKRKP